jgi:hypothetical protein
MITFFFKSYFYVFFMDELELFNWIKNNYQNNSKENILIYLTKNNVDTKVIDIQYRKVEFYFFKEQIKSHKLIFMLLSCAFLFNILLLFYSFESMIIDFIYLCIFFSPFIIIYYYSSSKNISFRNLLLLFLFLTISFTFFMSLLYILIYIIIDFIFYYFLFSIYLALIHSIFLIFGFFLCYKIYIYLFKLFFIKFDEKLIYVKVSSIMDLSKFNLNLKKTFIIYFLVFFLFNSFYSYSYNVEFNSMIITGLNEINSVEIDYLEKKINFSDNLFVKDKLSEFRSFESDYLIIRRNEIYEQNKNSLLDLFSLSPNQDINEYFIYSYNISSVSINNFERGLLYEVPFIKRNELNNSIFYDGSLDKKSHLTKLKNLNSILYERYYEEFREYTGDKSFFRLGAKKIMDEIDYAFYLIDKNNYIFSKIDDLDKLEYDDVDSNILIQSVINSLYKNNFYDIDNTFNYLNNDDLIEMLEYFEIFNDFSVCDDLHYSYDDNTNYDVFYESFLSCSKSNSCERKYMAFDSENHKKLYDICYN